jgi:hypothetical protein
MSTRDTKQLVFNWLSKNKPEFYSRVINEYPCYARELFEQEFDIKIDMDELIDITFVRISEKLGIFEDGK